MLMLLPAVSQAEDIGSCSGRYYHKIAIFIEPTEAEVEQMRKEFGSDFNDSYDDWNYYQWQSVELFRKYNFPHCVTENNQHVFSHADRTTIKIDADCSGWCLLLWNGKDKPAHTSAIDLFNHLDYLGLSASGE